jgi:3-phosphoshikimate 1-carboxyvinyltransferase
LSRREFSSLSPVTDLHATVSVPGSKSLTNRALLVAALSQGRSRLTRVLLADDTRRMLEALSLLEIGLETDESAGTVTVEGRGGALGGDGATLDIGNAGTAMRFLLAALAATPGRRRLTGNARMCERPIASLVDALRSLGASIQHEGRSGCPPLLIDGRNLDGGSVTLQASTSSQFLSALLLAGPLFSLGISIRPTDLVSRPYVDLTTELMRSFGVEVTESEGVFIVPGGSRYTACNHEIEGDASSASYFLAAAAIAGGRVEVGGVGTSSSQGDARFAGVLEKMGCTVEMHPHRVVVTRTGRLHGVDVDMNAMPDVAVTLAPVAACAEGTTVVRNVANLRVKESDRIAAVCTELGRCGIAAEATPDGFVIHGGTPHAAAFETYDDHRIAMAFSLIGLVARGVRVLDPGCVAKTFPGYFDRLLEVVATGRPRPGLRERP